MTERSSAIRLPPAREGGPLEAPPEASKTRIFASFPITIGAQNCIGRGWLRSSTQKKSRKSRQKYMQRVAMIRRSYVGVRAGIFGVRAGTL